MGKIDNYEFKTRDPELTDFKDSVTNLLNNGKYSIPITVTAPTWSAGNGEMVFQKTNAVKRLHVYRSGWDSIDFETPFLMINFSGTAAPAVTINQSYGVDTLTRNSVGEYLIAFTNNTTNANLIANGMARDLSNNALIIAPITGSVSSLLIRFVDAANTLKDPSPAMVTIYGN